MKIYLAGGMHDNWRDVFVDEFPEFNFVDPIKSGLINPTEQECTQWDISELFSSDLVIVYMDAENPSGYGLSFEAGYARAKGIPVWFIDETDQARSKYFGMVRATSERVFADIPSALRALNSVSIFDGHG